MKKIGVLLLFLMTVGVVNVVAWGCSDTDGGKDFDEKGTVTYYGRTYTDRCYNSNYLKEYFCRYGRYRSSMYYRCPDGCNNGACITEPTSFCGDGVCDGEETCSTCETDCGECPPVCGNGIVEIGEECDDGNHQNGDGCDDCMIGCIEDWECSEWGECQNPDRPDSWNIRKYRTCTDLNDCGTTNDRPPQNVQCECYNTWVVEKEILNIGDPADESDNFLADWGPLEPDTNGGNWGKSPTGSSCCPYGDVVAFDGNTRVVSTTDTGDSASHQINFGRYGNNHRSHYLKIMALAGISNNDDFEVYIDGDMVYAYDDTGERREYCPEEWKEHVIELGHDIYGDKTVTFVSTAPHWSGYDTYGQIAISEVESNWRHSVRVCS